MEQGKGTISPTDLMSKLVKAKKVMTAVDGGKYEKGHINEDILRSDPQDLMNDNNVSANPVRQPGVPSVEKIKQSRLPDAIKQAYIDNPIPQISLNETLDMDFVKGAKRLMEQEGVQAKSSTTQRQNISSQIDMNSITTIIENTVRKVLDEKLNQILTAQQTQSINENLVLKVGDSVFKGKITGVNKAK